MKTVVVEGFGGPERLRLVERPTPRPGPGEVLLRLEACGLNFSDLLMRRGEYLGGPRPPFHPGMEAAGVVEAVGEGEAHLLDGTPARPSTRVVAMGAGGLQASHAAVPAAACAALPEGIPFDKAAALPVSWLTAYHALTTVGRAAAGEVVLVHAAAGGLGTAVVQIARRLGLRVVGTASSADKRARVEALGAEATADYDGFERAVRAVAGRRGPDLVIETVGGEVARRSLRLLPPFGRLVLVGMSGGEPPALDAVGLVFGSRAVLGLHLGAVLAHPDLLRPSLARILGWAEAGEIEVQVGRVLPLAEVARAHELLAGRRSWGKIVLVP